MIKGRCECNRVTYEVRGELKDFCHCHCSICQRIHGAAFVTWGGIARNEFTFKSGESHLKRYAFSERADSIFCGECGSTMLADFKTEDDMLYIALGTVVGDVKFPPGFHQFVDSKVPWYEIRDELPQYDEWPVETQE
jgi:hypothetical protein